MGWKEGFWLEWFGGHAGREAGKPHRKFLETSSDFIPYVQECMTQGSPCYLSVQPYRGPNQVYGLERLFFDFDSKADPPDLDKAWNEALNFVDALHKYYGVRSLLVFSGRKGYHVHAWLWQTIEVRPNQEVWAKAIYKTLQDKLLKGLHYETLDPEVLGDIKRLARVPYTVHEKSSQICIPLTENREKLWLPGSSLEEYRRKGLGPDLFQAVVKEVKTEERIRQKLQALRKREGKKYVGKEVRPCIEAVLQNPDLTHKMRVALVAEYHKAGLSQDEIETLFTTRPDYEAKRTKYQISHILRGGYSPFRCSTIQTLGFCLPSCPRRRTEK
jgi:hypothetical protein